MLIPEEYLWLGGIAFVLLFILFLSTACGTQRGRLSWGVVFVLLIGVIIGNMIPLREWTKDAIQAWRKQKAEDKTPPVVVPTAPDLKGVLKYDETARKLTFGAEAPDGGNWAILVTTGKGFPGLGPALKLGTDKTVQLPADAGNNFKVYVVKDDKPGTPVDIDVTKLP